MKYSQKDIKQEMDKMKGELGVYTDTDLTDFVNKALQKDAASGIAGYLANVKIYWTDHPKIQTAAAGLGYIFINKKFFNSLDKPKYKLTIFLHEAWHLILNHSTRGVGRNPEVYNRAADYVINLILHSSGLDVRNMTINKGEKFSGLLDEKYIFMSTEQVYNQLIKERNKNPSAKYSNEKDHLSKEDIEDLVKKVMTEIEGSNQSIEQLEKENENNITENIDPSKVAGYLGSRQFTTVWKNPDLEVLLDVPYEEIFKKYLVDPLTKGDRTYKKPSRRQHSINRSTGLVLAGRVPSKVPANRLKHLVYALDVSGSISEENKEQFTDSVRYIKKLLNPSKLTILFFDTRITYEKTYTDRENITSLDVESGGGTSLRDVYKRAKELDTEALVVFTDLEVAMPDKPKWDSIWIIPHVSSYTPPDVYGKIYMIPTI